MKGAVKNMHFGIKISKLELSFIFTKCMPEPGLTET